MNKNNKKVPKLILLNGPPGIGKSTLSKRYTDNHPMTLNIDIDHIWWMMGQWQESRPESEEQKFVLANALVDAHLSQGYDVIIAQHVATTGYYKKLESIVDKYRAKLIEITLLCSEKDAVQRCIDRGLKAGYKNGFRPGGILESEGGANKLKAMYREMINEVSNRQSMHYIESVYGDEDATNEELNKTINNN